MTAENFETGMAVRFHPIVGGKHDGRRYTIHRLGHMFGRPVAWLAGKSGCVAVAALSPIAPGYLIDSPQPAANTEDATK